MMPGDVVTVDGRACEQRLLEWLSEAQARGLRVKRLKLTMRQWHALTLSPGPPEGYVLTFCGIPVDVDPFPARGMQ